MMKIFFHFKLWWLLLVAGTFVVSLLTSSNIAFMSLLISVAGHLLFSIIVALIPMLFYWIIRRPLNNEQMMCTITAGWLILAIANLSV
ncbi:hypothetical protein SAMN06265219_10999 [Gracilimonas mengyeensis]|uniref:Uncharacterized protein n=1 Tax=Gracilimonas mengyeensis TaxID=1302730 RepID=A0A521DT24_9BACT|nr:hypothetical protein SAMN06265219_10999 [Gracilimonas mengyeensis]